MKLLKPPITYIQAKQKFLKQASTDKSNMSIYTVRQKLMNLFQIGLLSSLPVHTYLLTCEAGY